MAVRTVYDEIEPFRTKDGSLIRELLHPAVHGTGGTGGVSLAEATVLPGAETLLHRHRRTDEIYHFTEGTGMMVLGEESFAVKQGDTVFIPSAMPHKIRNTGTVVLKILCCCSPPYSHEDTELEAG